jgi:hypothetical protein
MPTRREFLCFLRDYRCMHRVDRSSHSMTGKRKRHMRADKYPASTIDDVLMLTGQRLRKMETR